MPVSQIHIHPVLLKPLHIHGPQPRKVLRPLYIICLQPHKSLTEPPQYSQDQSTVSPPQPPDHPPIISSSSIEISHPVHHMVTRSRTGTLRSKEFPDFKLFYASKHPLHAFTGMLTCVEPQTFYQAILSQEWQQAMQVEYDALLVNNTWDLVPRRPDQHVIRTKWVYKIKQKTDGSIDCYKARLVALGFQQVSGVDFAEMFSPVIKPATVRVVLALSVFFDWPILQFDVSNAFLHGTLEEKVYIEQPRGFIDLVKPEHVCRLKKALYGLKQAPRAWFLRFSSSLLDLRFVGSSVDSSLFTYHCGRVHVFVLIYVDDLLIIGSSPSFLATLTAQLKNEFALKDLGKLGYFLGIEASRDTHGLHLRQSKYILDVFHRARMVGAKPYSAPYVSGSQRSARGDEPIHDITAYRQIIDLFNIVL